MAHVETGEVRVKKNGIHCAGCEARIESVLSRIAGIQQVKASQKTQVVTLSLDTDQVTMADVRHKLDELGYQPAE